MNERLQGINSDRSFLGDYFDVVAAAHELKSPVALIRQLALNLKDLDNLTESTRQDYISRIILTSERSLRLTSILTQSEKINEELFNTEPINIKQLCEDVAHELTPLYKAYGRKIMVKGRRSAPLVVANRDLLRRILLGFGDNALHYSNKEAVFNLAHNANKIRVGLRDFGPSLSGININNQIKQQRIYRPESSGLGLVIAKRFADAINGNIGTIRHRNGMTYYVDVIKSEQLCLL